MNPVAATWFNRGQFEGRAFRGMLLWDVLPEFGPRSQRCADTAGFRRHREKPDISAFERQADLWSGPEYKLVTVQVVSVLKRQ